MKFTLDDLDVPVRLELRTGGDGSVILYADTGASRSAILILHENGYITRPGCVDLELGFKLNSLSQVCLGENRSDE